MAHSSRPYMGKFMHMLAGSRHGQRMSQIWRA